MILSISVDSFAEHSVRSKSESLIEMASSCVGLEDVQPKPMGAVLVECASGHRSEEFSSQASAWSAYDDPLQLNRLMLGSKPQ